MSGDVRNWRGLPVHPTDTYLFWRSTTEKMVEVRALYAQALHGDKDALDELLSVIADEVRRDEVFNNEDNL